MSISYLHKKFIFALLLLIPFTSFANKPQLDKTKVQSNHNASDSIALLNTNAREIIRISLKRNRTIKGSFQNIESSHAQVMQARSIHGAKISGNFRQARVDDVAKGPAGNDLGKKVSQQAYLEVTQPLFLSGKAGAALKSARLGRKTAKARHTLTKQTIIQSTIMKWLSWLFSIEAEQVSQKDFELAKAHYELVSKRLRQKQASEFERLRAEVRLAQARSDLRKQTNNRELACLDLLRILDFPEDTPVSTKEKLKMVEYEIDPEKDAIKALDLREDLRSKRLEVKMAKQAIEAARSENKPTVSLFGQTGFQDPSSKSSMGKYERKGYWQVGLVANFTLNDGGMRKGKIKQAHARLAQAQNDLENSIEQAKFEIRQAFLTIKTAKEVVFAQQKALKQAEEALRLANVRYSNGLFTQVELFDAENAYLATRLQYYQAIFSYDQAVVAYGLATGRLGREFISES